LRGVRVRGHNDTENKKGPPFGEPFLILRMVPAPGVENHCNYMI
jgi:hypothetical protein